MHGHSALPVAFAGLLLLASSAAAQAPLPTNSPFVPPAGTNPTSAPAGERLEFAGVSVMGSKTDLIIHDRTTRKNRWIGLGATIDGVTAVSYDPKQEQAVIKENGVEKTLSLRKPSGPINAPAPIPVANTLPAPLPAVVEPAVTAVPADPAAAPTPTGAVATPASPQQIAREETEARMLVSDLLEIGMAQRKAYEEARRKAAAGQAAPAAPATWDQLPVAPAPATPAGQPAANSPPQQ